MADEVSMTKITLRPDQAAVAAEVLDLDQRGARHLQTIAPFDDERAILGELLQAKAAELGAVLDAIKVDVSNLHRPGVDANQLKGWARDGRHRAGAPCHAAHESGLPRSELAGQQDHVAGSKALAQAFAGGLGLCRRGGDELVR